MKNILVLSPTPSHPQDAGNRKRIFALTKYLQELGAKIYFVYCPREWDREIPKAAYDGMNQCWDYFFVAYPVQAAVHQTDNEYFELDDWWDIGIEFTINWIKLAADIDIVLCNYIFYSKVLDLFDENVTKVIDTHDITSNRNYLLDRKLGYRDFFYVSPESEKKALDRAHLVLSIKEDESSWFQCLSSTPVLTIGHLEPKPLKIVDQAIDNHNIKLGFIGSANPINVKNLESFLDKYFTLDNKYRDEFTVVVGGKICNVLDDRFRDQVTVIGMVDNVSEFYEQVDIIVLPFEFSTGLKIKTVEALSWSKPCIGTVNAFEGLGSDCKYHSFESIEKLATCIVDLSQDSQSIISELTEESSLVFNNYSNRVKRSIEKLYNFDWKSVKELQSSSKNEPPLEVAEIRENNQYIYNFNIVTNIDFWNSFDNQSAWINWWIDHATQLGNVNIYRTDRFKNIDTDKLELYRRGLVNNVHHRELYQIIDIFKITPDENQIFINVLDFDSVIKNNSCLRELDNLQLAKNHSFWYFFTESDNNKYPREEYINNVYSRDYQQHVGFCWGDSSRPKFLDIESKHQDILLIDNPVSIHQRSPTDLCLNQIVIGTCCLDESSLQELDKLSRCCNDFLPSNFELVILSDLELVINEYQNVYSLKQAQNLLPKIDLFLSIEDPKIISFLVYLCICSEIPIFYKQGLHFDTLAGDKITRPIKNFTTIPEAYKSFLETSSGRHKVYPNATYHSSWTLFIEYLASLSPDYTHNFTEKYSTIN
ncbi:MAG: glycosyltransferase [Cyanobacteria bacterium J06621_8]